MRQTSTLVFGCVLAVCALTASAQSPDPGGPEFEVASVRENTSSGTPRRIEVLPGGQFNAINMTLREIVSIVYPTDGGRFRHADQLVGGPGWFESARFDIVAKTDARGGRLEQAGIHGDCRRSRGGGARPPDDAAAPC